MRISLVLALFLLSGCAPAVAVAPEPSTSSTPSVTAAPSVTSEPTSSAPSVTPTAAPTSSSTPAPAPVTENVQVTWYGSLDNDPKGSTAIDSPVIHKTAGGTGTFADPLTFASPVGPDGSMAYGVGARIYYAAVQKYFIREDSCAVSWTAPNGCGALTHVDLYIGNPSGTKAVLKCEEALTPDGLAPIVVNPAPDLPVDPTPLWDGKTCHVR